MEYRQLAILRELRGNRMTHTRIHDARYDCGRPFTMIKCNCVWMIGKETASARIAWAHHIGKMHMISSHFVTVTLRWTDSLRQKSRNPGNLEMTIWTQRGPERGETP